MGRRGPAPKPTSLRLLHGDRKDRINTAEPRPRNMPPERPGWLSALAAEEWDRIAPDLVAMGTVRAVDATALAAYCEAVARLRSALGAVAGHGLIVTDVDGIPHRNPAAAMARDASNEIRLWAREFGLTPSARSPLRVDVSHHGLPAERLLT
jgi:P27 family predicted phage terminase small subunit